MLLIKFPVIEYYHTVQKTAVLHLIEDGDKINFGKVTIEVVRNAITTACLAITVGGAVVDQQLSHDDMMKLMNV